MSGDPFNITSIDIEADLRAEIVELRAELRTARETNSELNRQLIDEINRKMEAQAKTADLRERCNNLFKAIEAVTYADREDEAAYAAARDLLGSVMAAERAHREGGS